jgi:nitrite reductase/ring-hydroxylating ferredoxin subunit
VDSPLGGPVLTVLEAPAAGRWLPVDEAGQFDHGGPVRRDVGGASLLFMRSGDDLYAYVDRCPACRAPLEDPTLDGHALRCGGCGRRYDVRRAGVGVDGGLLGLDPVPLLVERGRVRVAVEAGVA